MSTQITVKVNAGSKTEGVKLLERGFYQVRTRAPAEQGKANRRVLELLAEELGCSPDRLRILSGATRPVKKIAVG